MGSVLLTGEAVVILLVTALVLLTGWLYIRRWLITKDSPVMVISVRRPGGWQIGMARSTPLRIEWFPILGVSLRARRVWPREGLELGPPTAATDAPAMLVDPVDVEASSAGAELRLALSRADYTVLRSWSESAPPGQSLYPA